MRRVFLDTVGLIALWDSTDQWYLKAKAAMRVASVPGTEFVTTPLILIECANAAARNQYRRDVCSLRDRMAREGTILEPAGGDVDIAWEGYRLNTAGGASIVDHVSFTIMRRLRITDAFTNDRHFKAAGFNTLF